MRKNILITGLPKSGKSTTLKNIVSPVVDRVGFITNEVRLGSERTGFEIETHQGKKATLADINSPTGFKVSRYFVDVAGLDAMVAQIGDFGGDSLLYLDEIGQMELFSESFKLLAERYLDSENICIATISKVYEDAFIEKIKKREDVIVVELSEENRAPKEAFIRGLLRKIMKAKRYVADPARFTVKADRVSIVTDHGTRHLVNAGGSWSCECDFFAEHGICSHVIALEEFLKADD